MVAPIFSIFGVNPVQGYQNPSTARGPLALGTGSPTPPSISTDSVGDGEDDGLKAPSPGAPAQGVPDQSMASTKAQILAMLPSAQKARQQQTGSGGLGDVLASGVDAAKGHSAFGAFAAGFAHGMKSADDYSTARAKGDLDSMKTQVDLVSKIFGMQKDQATQAETARHNQATEANSAKSTSNLGEYYKSIAKKKDEGDDSGDAYKGAMADKAMWETIRQQYADGPTALKQFQMWRSQQPWGKTDPPKGVPGGSDMPVPDLTKTPGPAAPAAPIASPGGGAPDYSRDGDPLIQNATPAPAPAPQAPAAPPAPPVPQKQGGLPPGMTAPMVVEQARAAIAAGKDPAAVKARLQSLGIDDSGF